MFCTAGNLHYGDEAAPHPDLITRGQHRDHVMAIVALARQIGPVIAAAPPEDWNNLICTGRS